MSSGPAVSGAAAVSGSLSAVEQFDLWHDRDAAAVGASRSSAPPVGPAHAERLYGAPLPAAAPGPGQQYRFEVDLDACSGCKACVTACRSLNGLEAQETWRSVGLLVGGGRDGDAPWMQHVTTACHHCLDPACLAGCPVDAYEKDPVTGIVAHLDDQCIGCRYCMLTCPYEVPQFSDRLGIVRKCDMCTGRLSAGEAPACVQGCPTNAISVGVVSTAELSMALASEPSARLVPTAPSSQLSKPTTLYRTERPVPEGSVPADHHLVAAAEAHPPLVAMLVLTQVSVGAYLAMLATRLGEGPVVAGGATDWATSVGTAVVPWMVALVALAASVFHLGRPTKAWRVVLGVRRSWLSREIVAFGAYATLGGVVAFTDVITGGQGYFSDVLAVAAAAVGLVGLWCSVKLYSVTGRLLWRTDRTSARFAWTASAGGAALAAASAGVLDAGANGASAGASGAVGPLEPASVVAGATIAGLAGVLVFLVRHHGIDGELGRSARLLVGPLRPRLVCGVALAVVAVALALAASRSGGSVAVLLWVSATAAVVSAAFLERSLFFLASAPDRMPGAHS